LVLKKGALGLIIKFKVVLEKLNKQNITLVFQAIPDEDS